jgi:N-acetylmuramic acid 6-phosphate etherase
MTRLGLVYGNLMVNLNPKNSKLAERGVSILRRAAKVTRETAQRVLKEAGNSVPVALVMLQAEVDRQGAEQALESSRGHVRQAIAAARSL